MLNKFKNFGVIKIDGSTVKVFETQTVYSNINVGQSAIDFSDSLNLEKEAVKGGVYLIYFSG